MKTFRATGTAQGNLNEMTSGNLRVGMARQQGTSLMDPQGNIIQSHNYTIDTFLVLQSVKRCTDNEFYFTGSYYKDSCAIGDLRFRTYHPAVGKMDSLGNILTLRYYVLNGSCPNNAGDLEVIDDKGVIAWGRDYRLFLLNIDSTGAPVWAQRFDEKGAFGFIKELPGGDLLAGINLQTAGAVVARLDPGGNFLWCKSYIRPRGYIHDCVVDSDDAFVITGFTDSTASTNPFEPLPSGYDPKLFLMKLDGTGNVQWCRGYDSPSNLWYVTSGTRLVKAQDDNYVVLADIGVQTTNYFYRPFLMKTDQNGDTLWTRSWGLNGYAYETNNLLAYSDGGFMFNGRIWGDLPDGQFNWAYLYKTDSLGHLPCSEHYHQIEVLDLFPSDSSFTLTSIDGATALPAFIQDTIYPPITVYDACTFLPASMNSSTGRSRTPRIYPNPNTGRFTVQFPDPLMAESYYSVYDALGKLLYQRPLPTGTTLEQVDLSRFGRGTYAIKFTSPDGVCYERVVLE